MHKNTTIFVLVLVLSSIQSICGIEFDMTRYFKMPPKYRYDDFDRCFKGTNDLAIYCATKTYIKPDPTNKVWNIVDYFSRDRKRTYRHDIILSAVCVNWCRERMKNVSDEGLLIDEFDFDDHNDLDPTLFAGLLEFRANYTKDLSKCTNVWLKENYNLTGYTKIIFCSTNKEVKTNDTLDYLFLVFFGSVVFISMVAAYYDRKLNYAGTLDHYKSPLTKLSRQEEIILSFSAVRNWYRFVSVPKTDVGRDLRYIQAIRFITIFFVIYGHTIMGYLFAPMLNPDEVEKKFNTPFNVVMFNGLIFVQSFFAISGFILAVPFMDLTSKQKKFEFKYFWITLLYRYLRLTPVYAFMILFDATWLYKIQDGPGWKRMAETERSYCRKNWWANLIYINNYVNVREICIPQSWFLAADYQLFVVALCVLMLVWRYPKSTKWLVGIVLSIFMIIPGIVTYVYKYEGAYIIPPEDRKFMFEQPEFRNNYAAGHVNGGNYFCGVAVGILYHNMKRINIELGKSKLVMITWYVMVPIGLTLLFAPYLFYVNDFPKPSLWMAAFSVLLKATWAIYGLLIFIMFTGKEDFAMRRFFHAPIFQPLGRAVYCIYLCHFTIMRWLHGWTRLPVYVSNTVMFGTTVSSFTVSFFIGVLLCLFLEFPATALFKLLLRKDPKTKSEQEEELNRIRMANNNNNNIDDKHTV